MWPDTYSQYDEQQAILRYFEGARPDPLGHRSFLDIGAWDPIWFSNTRALFLAGWSGVTIEPTPKGLSALLKEYGNEPRVTIISGALALATIPQVFQITDDSLSTSSPLHYEQWKDKAAWLGKLTVLTLTWAQINNWLGGFDFVNIDTEGYSVDLFHEMLASGAKPPCVCVEHDGRLPELGRAATDPNVGYKMIYANATNAVFAL